MTRIPPIPARAQSAAGRLALLGLIALSGIGCASAFDPAAQPSISLPVAPEAWRDEAAEVVDPAAADPSEAADPSAASRPIATWWQRLDDPVLDRLVTRTLDGSLDLQTAAARVAEARARRGLAQADLGPRASLGLDAASAEPLGDGRSSEGYAASFTASWEADLFGEKRATRAASEADLAASVAQLDDARVSLIAEVVVAYADLRAAEARLRVIDDSLASRDATYRLTGHRERAGLASQLEVDQALTSREQTRASRSTFVRRAIDARLRLTQLAGQPPGAFDDLLTSPDGDSTPHAVPTLPAALDLGVPAEALARRPDVRAAAHRLDATLARRGVAEAARYPTLRLTGSLDGQSGDLSDLFDADAFFANLLAGLTAPVFESGRITQNIHIEQARVEQEALAYRDRVLQALAEVESALASLRTVGHELDALDDAIRSARAAATLADQRYAAGLVDLLVVLDSQRTLLNLQEQHVAAQGERVVAFSNLYRALGGGWETGADRGGDHA
ncbi:MAG: TolC family protein [Acidobacteriota bacterium]